MSSATDVFLEIFQKFLEQLCRRAIVCSYSGYSRRNGWVTQTLLKSALSSAIHKISKFKTFLLLLRCPIWSFDTKNIQNCIIVIFHLMHLTKPSGYNVSSHLPFHN